MIRVEIRELDGGRWRTTVLNSAGLLVLSSPVAHASSQEARAVVLELSKGFSTGAFRIVTISKEPKTEK